MHISLVLFAGISVANAAETFNGQTFFFGDLHAHTGVSPDGQASDGGLEDAEVYEHWESVSATCPIIDCGSMEAVFYTAAIDNGLDFMALSDHHDSDQADFDWLLGLSLDQTDILVIPSVELRHETTDIAHYGHKNMYVFQDGDLTGLDLATMVAGSSVRDGFCQEDIFANVAAVDAAFGPSLLWAHHPSASSAQTTDWSCHDEDYEPVVEIYSGWGNALTSDAPFDSVDDDFNPDKFTDDWDSTDATVDEVLEIGYRLGFVGGTDGHATRPGEVCDARITTGGHKYAGGLTMVVLDGDDASLTRSAIHGELTERRTLVTSGPQIPVQVLWTLAGGAGTREIGDVIDVPSRGYTTLEVSVPSGYEDIVKGVRAVGYDKTYTLTESSTVAGSWSKAIPNAKIPSWLYVEVAIDGAVYYPLGCYDGGTDDDEFVWSSPTWFI